MSHILAPGCMSTYHPARGGRGRHLMQAGWCGFIIVDLTLFHGMTYYMQYTAVTPPLPMQASILLSRDGVRCRVCGARFRA